MANPYQVTLTKSGEKDFLDLLRKVETEYSHSSAVSVHDKLIVAFEKLEKMPTAYPVDKRIKSKSGFAYRHLQAGKYYVVYRVEEIDADVFVVMIHHIKRGNDFFGKELP